MTWHKNTWNKNEYLTYLKHRLADPLHGLNIQ